MSKRLECSFVILVLFTIIVVLTSITILALSYNPLVMNDDRLVIYVLIMVSASRLIWIKWRNIC